MRLVTAVAGLSMLALTATADAQWAKAPPRKGAARQTDLSGMWRAETSPVPKGVLTVEGDVEFPRYMVNLAADMNIPPTGLPFQPWAAELFGKRLQGSGAEDPAGHCKPGGPPLLDSTPLPLKIVQTRDLVLVLHEENTVFRQIFLDGRRPVEDPAPRYLGYSTGKWDGATLVVDTIGFNDMTWLDAMGHPASDKLHLIERFRRVDAGHLAVEITIDDPGAYTKPFGYTVKYTLVPGEDLLEYFCTDNEKDAQHYQ